MDKEYRQKVRSLSFNLSDANNPELRARVLQGEVAPERLVSMTPNELASKVSRFCLLACLSALDRLCCVDTYCTLVMAHLHVRSSTLH